LADLQRIDKGLSCQERRRSRRTEPRDRNFAAAYFYRAVALAELGRLDEAFLDARQGLSIDPTFTIRRYRTDSPSDNAVFLGRRKEIYKIMKSVGLPEG
jgi:hypothetical protein